MERGKCLQLCLNSFNKIVLDYVLSNVSFCCAHCGTGLQHTLTNQPVATIRTSIGIFVWIIIDLIRIDPNPKVYSTLKSVRTFDRWTNRWQRFTEAETFPEHKQKTTEKPGWCANLDWSKHTVQWRPITDPPSVNTVQCSINTVQQRAIADPPSVNTVQ